MQAAMRKYQESGGQAATGRDMGAGEGMDQPATCRGSCMASTRPRGRGWRRSLQEWMTSGQTLGELELEAATIFGPDRAAVIAVTEATGPITEGNRAAADELIAAGLAHGRDMAHEQGWAGV